MKNSHSMSLLVLIVFSLQLFRVAPASADTESLKFTAFECELCIRGLMDIKDDQGQPLYRFKKNFWHMGRTSTKVVDVTGQRKSWLGKVFKKRGTLTTEFIFRDENNQNMARAVAPLKSLDPADVIEHDFEILDSEGVSVAQVFGIQQESGAPWARHGSIEIRSLDGETLVTMTRRKNIFGFAAWNIVDHQPGILEPRVYLLMLAHNVIY